MIYDHGQQMGATPNERPLPEGKGLLIVVERGISLFRGRINCGYCSGICGRSYRRKYAGGGPSKTSGGSAGATFPFTSGLKKSGAGRAGRTTAFGAGVCPCTCGKAGAKAKTAAASMYVRFFTGHLSPFYARKPQKRQSGALSSPLPCPAYRRPCLPAWRPSFRG